MIAGQQLGRDVDRRRRDDVPGRPHPVQHHGKRETLKP